MIGSGLLMVGGGGDTSKGPVTYIGGLTLDTTTDSVRSSSLDVTNPAAPALSDGPVLYSNATAGGGSIYDDKNQILFTYKRGIPQYIHTFDCSDPTNLVMLAEYDNSTHIDDTVAFAIDPDRLLLWLTSDDDLTVCCFSYDPNTGVLTFEGKVQLSGPWGMQLDKEREILYVYDAADTRFFIFDVSVAGTFTQLAVSSGDNADMTPRNIALDPVNQLLFVCGDNSTAGRVETWDVSNSSAPVNVGRYATGDDCFYVFTDLDRNLLFIFEDARLLSYSYDGTPVDYTTTQALDTSAHSRSYGEIGYGLCVYDPVGMMIYATGDNDYWAYDVSNPSNLILVADGLTVGIDRRLTGHVAIAYGDP